MATGTLSSPTVLANGCQLQFTVTGGTWAGTLVVDGSKIAVTVTRQGYVDGVLGTVVHNVKGVIPGGAVLGVGSYAGGVLTVDLDAQLYVDEKTAGGAAADPTVVVSSGAFGDGTDTSAALTATTVTNNSTQTYEKALGHWVTPNITRLTGAFIEEIVAFSPWGVDRVASVVGDCLKVVGTIGTRAFAYGEAVTQATSNAKGLVAAGSYTSTGATKTLYLIPISGTFTTTDTISSDSSTGGTATMSGSPMTLSGGNVQTVNVDAVSAVTRQGSYGPAGTYDLWVASHNADTIPFLKGPGYRNLIVYPVVGNAASVLNFFADGPNYYGGFKQAALEHYFDPADTEATLASKTAWVDSSFTVPTGTVTGAFTDFEFAKGGTSGAIIIMAGTSSASQTATPLRFHYQRALIGSATDCSTVGIDNLVGGTPAYGDVIKTTDLTKVGVVLSYSAGTMVYIKQSAGNFVNNDPIHFYTNSTGAARSITADINGTPAATGTGTIQSGEVITGLSSGATATTTDVPLAGCDATHLTITTGAISVASFSIGETVTQATSGGVGILATGSDTSGTSPKTLYIRSVTTPFDASHEITGSTSGAKATASACVQPASDTGHPYFTPSMAARTCFNARGDSRADGATIYFKRGVHCIGTYSFAQICETWYYGMTLTHDAGLAANDVRIVYTAASAMNTQMVRYLEMSIWQITGDANAPTLLQGYNPGYTYARGNFWYDSCISFALGGRLTSGRMISPGGVRWFTNFWCHDQGEGPIGLSTVPYPDTAIVRDSQTERLSADAFSGTRVVCNVTELMGNSTDCLLHGDTDQYYIVAGITYRNYIRYHLDVIKDPAGVSQIGPFCNNADGAGVTVNGHCYVNCRMTADGTAAMSQLGDLPISNLFYQNCTILDQSAWLTHPYRITIGTVTGSMAIGHTITGSISGATGTITATRNANGWLYYTPLAGPDFQTAETITDGTTGGTATSSTAAVPNVMTVANVHIENCYFEQFRILQDTALHPIAHYNAWYKNNHFRDAVSSLTYAPGSRTTGSTEATLFDSTTYGQAGYYRPALAQALSSRVTAQKVARDIFGTARLTDGTGAIGAIEHSTSGVPDATTLVITAAASGDVLTQTVFTVALPANTGWSAGTLTVNADATAYFAWSPTSRDLTTAAPSTTFTLVPSSAGTASGFFRCSLGTFGSYTVLLSPDYLLTETEDRFITEDGNPIALDVRKRKNAGLDLLLMGL